MLRAKAQARTVLTKGNIDAVGLLGGFVAGSVLAAARAQGIPTLMLNLDAVPGRANRWIAARATALATAIEVVRPLATSTKPCTQLDGPPIRMEAQPRDGVTKAQHRAMLDLDPNARLLLVTGASQGAGTLNDLLHFLVQTEPTLLDGWQVLHLAGEGPKGTYVPPTATAKELQAAYDHAGIRARVETFRHTMGLAWGAADLVIARAGASTVGEARCAGVPAVYLPYPWHADGHQWSNAQPSIDEGMAEAVDDRINASQTFPAFRPVIEPLLQGDGLKAMTVAAQRVKGRSGGAQAAKMLLELALA
jgi:UDP-N-acetylglucosamine--N-acetylmuramyl-(pentapeptide) pyrophosphoryl-undecaprenol N-acetylglucosamine transferase